MKRFVLFAIIVCIVAAAAFAQSYTVQSVTGRVEREAGSQRTAVAAGDVLSAETVVYTGVGASLVLKEGTRTLTVPAARSGKVSDLIDANAGVRINGNVARTDTSAIARTSGPVSTASARASDAAQDDDIAAE